MKIIPLLLSLVLLTPVCRAQARILWELPDPVLSTPLPHAVHEPISRAAFILLAEELEALYAEDVWREKGLDLIIYKSWMSEVVNANVVLEDDDIKISLHGGLARHPLMTPDGFTLLVCHEIGHILGGGTGIPGVTWAAAEGQADYFATSKCLRRYWQDADNSGIIAGRPIPPEAARQCPGTYTDEDEAHLCLRSAMAGLSLAAVFHSLNPDETGPGPALDTPDLSETPFTRSLHPPAQCRLDTYYQGALCDRHWQEVFSDYDRFAGACNRRDGYTTGVRPACWFRP